MAEKDKLFRTKKFSLIQADKLEQARKKVNKIPVDQFAELEAHTIEESIFCELEITPLVLHETHAEQRTEESHISNLDILGRHINEHSPDYNAQRIDITIPFSGDAWLWGVWPTTFSSQDCYGSVQSNSGIKEGGILTITNIRANDSPPDHFLYQHEENMQLIRENIENTNSDISNLNDQIRKEILSSIHKRRSQLDNHARVCEMLEIPLVRREGVPDVSSLKITPRIVAPLPSVQASKREHGISDDCYESILRIIRHFGRTLESTPYVFANLGEEAIRDFFLAALNTIFEGSATGESFRKNGKTDIRIEEQNRAAFVAECKIWHGSDSVTKSIEQLDGYTTWRDCKTSLIHFNKDASGFSKIQTKFEQALKKHPNCIANLKCQHAGEWRFSYRKADDPQRTYFVHAFLFNYHENSIVR